MKILGRKPSHIITVFRQLFVYISASFRCLKLFHRPFEVLWCYIRRKNPSSQLVSLRDGIVIHLSGDNSDIVTVFIIFCRLDYGKINPGCSVIDIGANIGVFSIYAARAGAKSIKAYEPAEESFALLRKNIEQNGYAKIIYPFRAAVVGKQSKPVWFPRHSNVFNAIETSPKDSSDYDLVPSIPFKELIRDIPEPNLVKLDCEGGEYDIILNSEDAIFKPIKEIRLEYHRGPSNQLITRLDNLGFTRYQFMDEGEEGGGYLWLMRATF